MACLASVGSSLKIARVRSAAHEYVTARLRPYSEMVSITIGARCPTLAGAFPVCAARRRQMVQGAWQLRSGPYARVPAAFSRSFGYRQSSRWYWHTAAAACSRYTWMRSVASAQSTASAVPPGGRGALGLPAAPWPSSAAPGSPPCRITERDDHSGPAGCTAAESRRARRGAERGARCEMYLCKAERASC
eukprot:scaffold151407_cov33-Tisochrysis_lutea.AAC.1